MPPAHTTHPEGFQAEPSSGLGLVRFGGVRRYVDKLSASVAFHAEVLGLPVEREAEVRAGERAARVGVGSSAVVLAEPVGPGRARRFLDRHPEGVGEIVLEVRDVARAFRWFEARGGTPLDEVADGPNGPSFQAATPIDDVELRFVEAAGSPRDAGGAVHGIDHLTVNFRTMAPAVLWLEHVVGLRRVWEVAFHTAEAAAGEGSGLRSVVMADPATGFRVACNEPLRPRFEASQIARYVVANGGSGVQHVAVRVDDLVARASLLKAHGAALNAAPDGYHDRLDDHLASRGLPAADLDREGLRAGEILVDGNGDAGHLLQVFLAPGPGSGGGEGSPFFYELIERRGDDGFGAGNFRALFEGIERTERTA